VFIYLTIVIQFDELPSETGWSLLCNDGREERTVPANTYSVPHGIFVETFRVPWNASCEFTMTDTFGDGICCAFGNGYYQVIVHNDENDYDFEEEDVVEENNDNNVTVVVNRTGINPFDVQTVSFVASTTTTTTG